MTAAIDGASRALTTTSPLFTSCAGAVLVALAIRTVSWRASSFAIAAGVCAGFLLHSVAPPEPREVSMRAPGGHIRVDVFEALDALDADPSAFAGRTISVSGTWMPPRANFAATVSRRVMTCCAADAVDVGFDVVPSSPPIVSPGTWVRVSGHVRGRLRAGDLRYEIDGATVLPTPQY